MSVKVAIRVRPFNQRQQFLGCVSCVQMKNNTTVVRQNRGKDKKEHFFTFDYSFWSHDGFIQQQNGLLVPTDDTYIDQKRVYELLGEQILQNAWVGFNCCLFAYGQTGAGKSYSMIGYGVNKGIIPMACEELFQRIRRFEKKGEREYQVTISMLEIYNEKVQDLFINTNKRTPNGLKIRQNKTLGVYVEGLHKFPVNSYAEIQKKMDEGSKNRSLASTLMNEYSSRAHTIVMLQFIQKQWITNKKMNKKTSLINLVDLAGSQRVSKTGVGDNKDRLKEASLINKSLHTLGRVIEALADQCLGKGKNIAVPYRQSALTRILQNALGGNSKTTMICAISPANDNCEETLSTLRYADKTKKIKNKPVVNESQVDKLIRQLRQENQRLKKLLDTAQEEKISPMKEMLIGQSQSQRKQMRSNVRASMRQIQRQIRKNQQSFAINTDDIIDEADCEDSLMLTEYIDLEDPSFSSEIQTSFSSAISKSEVYITNLNEDEILNFKVKYSCQRNLFVTNSNSSRKNQFQDESNAKKVVLCGLGIEQNHARIVKDSNGKYFIEALSQTAAEYTLLNGKQVYQRQQLKHNDRIILGINSIFLFKNLLNPEQRQNKKYKNQKQVGYEFAINEREQELEDQGFLFYSNNNSPNRKKASSQISAKEQKQLADKLQQIQQQYVKLIQENQKQTREKQSQYKLKLIELQKQKQLKEKQKQNLESKLNQKKEETYKLKSKQLQIEKLQKKLAQFQQEKTKRQISRQSMLLDGLDYDNQPNDIFDPKDFVDIQTAKNNNQFGIGTDPQQNFKHKQTNKNKPQPKVYYDLVIQEYDDKDDKSALGTTNTNSIQIEESYFANQIDFQQDEPQNMMKKNHNKKPQTSDYECLSQAQQIQRYNKIVKIYLDKIKNKMGVFTKLFDITIYSQKIKLQQPDQMPEFNCEVNGGIHFCRHCKKAINNKIQHISYHQNRYEYNEVIKNKSEKSSPQEEDAIKKRHNIFSKHQNVEMRSDTSRHSYGEEKSEKNCVTSIQNGPKIRLSKSNLSDLLKSEEDKKINTGTQKSRNRSDSFGLSDDSLLLNGTTIDIDENDLKRKGSHVIGTRSNLNKIPEADLESSSNLQASNEKPNITQKHQPKRSVVQSSFALDLQDQDQIDVKISNLPTNQQYEENSLLQMYISKNDIDNKELTPKKIPKQKQYNFTISQQSSCQFLFQKPKTQQPRKPTYVQIQIQTQTIQEQKQSFEIKPKRNSGGKNHPKFLPVDFDFSVSDIEQGDHDNSVEQSLNFSSLNNFKEQQLSNQIELLKEKIKKLENDNTSQKVISSPSLQKPRNQSKHQQQVMQKQSYEISPQKSKIQTKIKKYIQKDQIQEMQSQEQADSPLLPQSKSKKLKQLPDQFSDKDFLVSILKKGSTDIQKQLQSNLLVCNNQNIINERNLTIRKRKREVDELKKTLIKKEKIELQKQLFVLIPMIERFNLMAKQMNRLIEARVQIEYKNFSHYDIIEALKNFTKSKWKKDASFSNVQIKVIVANLEEARIYKWAVEVFKNRFEIAEEVFQKFIENDSDISGSYVSFMINQNHKDSDKSRDPFWDPVDFVPSGFGYVSLECLLYNISFEGEVNLVFNTKVIAKAFVTLIPVKVKKRSNSVQVEEEASMMAQQCESQLQIFNPRNYLEQSLYFTFSIESITFQNPSRQNTSPPLKFTVSYQLLMDDYKTQTYTTPDIEFRAYEESHEINYLRRHCFKEVSQSTLAYISDCPIKITLNLMKDYNEECLNTSFNQDLERSVDQTSSLHDTSLSNLDITKELDNFDTKSMRTPEKSLIDQVQVKKLDFSKKQKKPLIYENTQLMDRIEREAQEQEKKRKEKRQKLILKQQELKGKKDKLKKDDKDCLIY